MSPENYTMHLAHIHDAQFLVKLIYILNQALLQPRKALLVSPLCSTARIICSKLSESNHNKNLYWVSAITTGLTAQWSHDLNWQSQWIANKSTFILGETTSTSAFSSTANNLFAKLYVTLEEWWECSCRSGPLSQRSDPSTKHWYPCTSLSVPK